MRRLEFLVLLAAVAVLVATTRSSHAPDPGNGVAGFFSHETLVANSLTLEKPRLTVDGIALGMSRKEVEILLDHRTSGPPNLARLEKRLRELRLGIYRVPKGVITVDYDRWGRVEHVLGYTLDFGGHQLLGQRYKKLEAATVRSNLGEPDSQGWLPSEHPSRGCWTGVKGFRYEKMGVTVLFSKMGRAGIHLGPHRGWKPAEKYLKLQF